MIIDRKTLPAYMIPLVIFFIWISSFLFYSCSAPQAKIDNGPSFKFFGGPSQGTFVQFAEGISKIAQKKGINIKNIRSKGSYENVRRVNSGEADFAISYASHVYQARNGLLKNDSTKYKDILVLGYLYGAYAHLIIRKGENILTAKQLVGKKVGVGKAGSGSFFLSKDFFKELGIWNKIEKRHTHNGFDPIKNFTKKKLDALWLMSTRKVATVSLNNDIDLINLYNDGSEFGFFNKYPYYEKAVIPGGRFRGVSNDILTFQDSVLLIANRHVSSEIVYRLLELIYSQDGIKFLEKKNKLAKLMRYNDGKYSISTPLHSGAIHYYSEK